MIHRIVTVMLALQLSYLQTLHAMKTINEHNPTPAQAHQNDQLAAIRTAKIIALSRLPLELQQRDPYNKKKQIEGELIHDGQPASILEGIELDSTGKLQSRLEQRWKLRKIEKPVSYFTGPHTPTGMLENIIKNSDGKYAITITTSSKLEAYKDDLYYPWNLLCCIHYVCRDMMRNPYHDIRSPYRTDGKFIEVVRFDFCDIEKQKKLFQISTSIHYSDLYSFTISPDNRQLFINSKDRNYVINLYPHYFDNPKNALNTELSKLTLRQFELMEGFAQAIKDRARIHPNNEQWETFQSLPSEFQQKLTLYIKAPESVSNNNNSK